MAAFFDDRSSLGNDDVELSGGKKIPQTKTKLEGIKYSKNKIKNSWTTRNCNSAARCRSTLSN